MSDTRRLDGTVSKLLIEKGYGFILAGETEYFFHRSSVRLDETGKDLWPGMPLHQPVTFIVRSSPKGPRAEDVECLIKQTPR